MKRLTIAALTITLALATRSAQAQTDAETKAMMAYSTPGEIHKMLAKTVGSWACKVTTWMEPGSQPTSSDAEAKNEMILGGRYLQSTSTGNFMGMPFEGIAITGYDNARKKFVNTWIDNMGTGVMVLTGTWDEATKSIQFLGTMVDPMSGKDVPVREVMKFVDDRTQVMEMYSRNAGKEFKTMEIKYTMK